MAIEKILLVDDSKTELHFLSDLLGNAHDLSMLRDYAESHPGCFADETSRQALLAVVDRRSDALRDKALHRGRRLYKRKPRRFARAVKRGWKKRASADPRILAS